MEVLRCIRDLLNKYRFFFILFIIPQISLSQTDCSLFKVTDLVIDNVNMSISIEIYNGNQNGVGYPYVSHIIDYYGDTIMTGNINLFGIGSLDTSIYNYILLSNITPIYPLKIYFSYFDSYGTDTCLLNYHPSCDSINIFFQQFDSINNPNILFIDVQTLDFSVGYFSYAGFVLINEFNDTIAYEEISTASNVFGLIQNNSEIRNLQFTQNISLPFFGKLHLINGWFAGNPATTCIFDFPSNLITQNNSFPNISIRKLDRIVDVLGRETNKLKYTPLFYLYNDGSFECKIITD